MDRYLQHPPAQHDPGHQRVQPPHQHPPHQGHRDSPAALHPHSAEIPQVGLRLLL